MICYLQLENGVGMIRLTEEFRGPERSCYRRQKAPCDDCNRTFCCGNHSEKLAEELCEKFLM